MQKIEDYIKSIPDFPKPGVLFRDVTGILDNAEGLRLTLADFYSALRLPRILERRLFRSAKKESSPGKRWSSLTI